MKQVVIGSIFLLNCICMHVVVSLNNLTCYNTSALFACNHLVSALILVYLLIVYIGFV